MDVFKYRDLVVTDYRSFSTSFYQDSGPGYRAVCNRTAQLGALLARTLSTDQPSTPPK